MTTASPEEHWEPWTGELVGRRLRHGPARWVLLIDGGSGSGKTSLARAVAAALRTREKPTTLVSLDDFYPGWDGLAAASAAVVEDVLRAEQPGYRRWDWAYARPAEWVPIDPTTDLIVEGCGALTPAAAAYADLSVWLECDTAARKHRALERDGDAFAPHWDRWAAQEHAHWSRHRPRELADLTIRVDAPSRPGARG